MLVHFDRFIKTLLQSKSYFLQTMFHLIKKLRKKYITKGSILKMARLREKNYELNTGKLNLKNLETIWGPY